MGRRRGGEAVVVAAANGVGGDGSVRASEGERKQRRGGEFGRVREFQGGGMARMEASGVSRWSGKQEVAGACAGVRRPRACAYWRAEEGDRGETAVGWAVLGRWWRQVSGWRSWAR